MLQPLHLRLSAQQGAHAPERLPLSLPQSSRGDGGESNIQGLTGSAALTTIQLLLAISVLLSICFQCLVATRRLFLLCSVSPEAALNKATHDKDPDPEQNVVKYDRGGSSSHPSGSLCFSWTAYSSWHRH